MTAPDNSQLGKPKASSPKPLPALTPIGRAQTPLYHRIYLVLRDGIVNGAYAHGAMLPSEQELTALYGVSRITAKRALNELAAEGLVARERGRGTRVTFDPATRPVTASVDGLYRNLVQMGRETEVRLLSFDYIAAAPDVARALACEPGETVQVARRVRSVDGEPFSHLTTYVPEDIGRSYGAGDLAKEPLIALLEQCGIQVSEAAQTITASLADGEIAALLKIDVGAPLLHVTRTVVDQRDRPVEHLIALYRPDRYQYRLDLRRVGDEAASGWAHMAEQAAE